VRALRVRGAPDMNAGSRTAIAFYLAPIDYEPPADLAGADLEIVGYDLDTLWKVVYARRRSARDRLDRRGWSTSGVRSYVLK
jgi:hypothetical protein